MAKPDARRALLVPRRVEERPGMRWNAARDSYPSAVMGSLVAVMVAASACAIAEDEVMFAATRSFPGASVPHKAEDVESFSGGPPSRPHEPRRQRSLACTSTPVASVHKYGARSAPAHIAWIKWLRQRG